ncbi:hypothetical protein LEP1GSC186_2063 [Leptospira noguchii serovar Autumnalis str. ZUN142]|uniref:Uncharacterized protein n=1 Tax=Leptospira noguchii serovar Autumnalis str. ZUN142 TaxID=1085540 RepID=M6UAW5_9LEPT|nr:hypothetical protein [Leptospira noguchii]EMO41660.1 hypothetical protein LEP1GSC186_2063 [Leptospira noguchii serovar Autumnalis str. ZUN142]
MKAENISLKKRKKNATLLRKGTDLTLNEDYIHLRDGSLWVASWAWPNLCFPITLQGAKQFLKNGKAI